jgi:LysM repeat protein
MKRVTLVILICLVLAATTTACRLVAPTPDPKMIERLVAEAVQATIEAMSIATPYPTYTPVPLALTYTPHPTNTVVYTGSTVSSAASATPKTQPSTSLFRTHIVVAGDTLSGIAKEYGTTVEAIVAANDISNPALIVVGQVLNIPIEEESISATETPTSPTPTATLMPPTATPTEIPAP